LIVKTWYVCVERLWPFFFPAGHAPHVVQTVDAHQHTCQKVSHLMVHLCLNIEAKSLCESTDIHVPRNKAPITIILNFIWSTIVLLQS
jgi:hypothetical protein